MPGIRKLFEGILNFRKTLRPSMVKEFEKVHDHPDPSAVLFTCMDSRLQPSKFMGAQIGELFVVRNSANMVPVAKSFGDSGGEVSVTTEPAALELAIRRGNVRRVVVCGHSDCKAINTLYDLYHGRPFDAESPMDHWLRRNGHQSVQKLAQLLSNGTDGDAELEFASENGLMTFRARIDRDGRLSAVDKLSQINTLQQLTNIASHEFLREYIVSKRVGLDAMWFDIFNGEIYIFSRKQKHFLPINESTSADLLREAVEQIEETAAADEEENWQQKESIRR
uniref:Carbonic anhydrase n=1 Tax=Globodera rostochiensis TaxID=31243 RepID=A0A914HZV2_GLORO